MPMRKINLIKQPLNLIYFFFITWNFLQSSLLYEFSGQVRFMEKHIDLLFVSEQPEELGNIARKGHLE